jgi:hypothetical protein
VLVADGVEALLQDIWVSMALNFSPTTASCLSPGKKVVAS